MSRRVYNLQGGSPGSKTLQVILKQCTKGSRPGASAGFTLLEVMVALAVVALLLVPLLRLHLLSLDATIRAQDLTTAVLLAQGHLAAMGDFPDPVEEEGTFEAPELVKYRWQTVVTEHNLDTTGTGSSNVEVRHIAVTILWIDGWHERHYTLQTYASR